MGAFRAGSYGQQALSAGVTTVPLLFGAVEAAAARHGQSHVPEKEQKKPLWKQHRGSKEGHRPTHH